MYLMPSYPRYLISVGLLMLGLTYAQAPSTNGDTPPADEAAQQADRMAEEYAKFADGFFRRGLYRMAAAEYERLINEYPTYSRTPEAYGLLAESYRKLDKFDNAEAIYRQLLAKHPDHAAAPHGLVNLVEMLVDQDRHNDALEVMQKTNLPNLTPVTKEALAYYKGTIYNQQKAYDKALDSYQQLPRNDFSSEYPYRPFAQLGSALILHRQQKHAEAKTLLAGLAESEDVAANIRQEALYKLGDIAFTQSNYQEAVDHFSRLISRYPQSPYTNLAIVSQGWCLLQLEAYKELLALFETPESRQLTKTGEEFYLRGTAAKELKLFESALASFQHLVATYPDSEFRPYASVGMVECLYFLKRFEECVQLGEAALAANPQHPFAMEIYQFLGQAFISMEQWQKLAETYQSLLTDYGEELEQKSDFIFLLADAYERINDYEKAAEAYRRLTSIKDQEIAIKGLLLAAENEMRAKRYNEAYADYQKIQTDYPRSPQVAVALIGMAECMTYLDKSEEAIDILNRFLQDYPDHPERNNALYLRGSLYFRLQRTKEAIADLASSLKEPNFEEKDYARLFLAYALWEEGKENEALQLFVDLLQKEEMEASLAPTMLKQIGRKYLQKNNIAAAEKSFQLLVQYGSEADKIDGMIGLGKTAFLKGEYQVANEIFSEVRTKAAPQSEEHVIALAYQGETFRRLGQTDRALLAFQDGLGIGTTDPNANALLRAGLAKLFYRQNKLEQALRYATSAFLLFDDPQHSPDGMLMAIRILVESDRLDEAKIAYTELASRFPIALARFKQAEENAALFKQVE